MIKYLTLTPEVYDSSNNLVTSNEATLNSNNTVYYFKLTLSSLDLTHVKKLYIKVYSSSNSSIIRLGYNNNYVQAYQLSNPQSQVYCHIFDISSFVSSFNLSNDVMISISRLPSQFLNFPFYVNNNSFHPSVNIDVLTFNSIPKSDANLTLSAANYIDYDFNFACGKGVIKKKIFDGIVPYNLFVVFDPLTGDYKLSFVELLDTSTMVLTNSFYKRIHFIPAVGSSTIYFDEEGSGLILEHTNSKYKLYYAISPTNYKEFNSSGRITKIVDSYNKTITISHVTNNKVTITDYNNNVIVFEKESLIPPIIDPLPQSNITSQSANPSISTKYYIKYNNVDFYQIEDIATHVNLGMMMITNYHLYFKEYFGTSPTTTVSFGLNSNKRINSFTSYRHIIALTYDFDEIVTAINSSIYVDSSTSSVLENYVFDYDILELCTIVTNYKNVITKYRFDDDLKIISSSEMISDGDTLKEITNFSYFDNVASQSIKRYKTKKKMSIGGLENYLYINNPSNTSSEVYPSGDWRVLNIINNSGGEDYYSFEDGKYYAIRVVMETSADKFDKNRYSTLKVRIYNNSNQYAQYETLFSDEGDHRIASIVFKVTDYPVYKISYSFSVFGITGDFYLKTIFIEEVSDYERLEYSNDGTFSNLKKYKPYLNDKRDESVTYVDNLQVFLEIPNAYISSEDAIINDFLRLKQLNYFFYNNQKGLITNFNLVNYVSYDDNNVKDVFHDYDARFVQVSNKNELVKESKQYFESSQLKVATSFSFNNFTTSTYKNINVSTNDIYRELDEYNVITITSRDDKGNIDEIQAGRNTDYNVFTYNYESSSTNRLLSKIEVIGSTSQTESYSYQSTTHLLSTITDAKSNVTSYSYNSSSTYNYLNKLTKDNIYNETLYNGLFLTSEKANLSPTFTFEYDDYNLLSAINLNNSNLLTITNSISSTGDSRSITTSNNYSAKTIFNKYNKPTFIKEGSINKVRYVYASIVNDEDLTISYDTTTINSESVLRFLYDYYASYSYRYKYDDRKNLIRISRFDSTNINLETASGPNYITINYYDNLNRIYRKTITSGNNALISVDAENYYTYDRYLKVITSIQSGFRFYGNLNGIESQKTTDNLNRLATLKNINSSGFVLKEYSYYSSTNFVSGIDTKLGNTLILHEEIDYDEVGNIASVTSSSMISETKTFEYDANNRLISETVGTKEIEYNYDSNGNLSSVVQSNNGVPVSTDSYSYNSSYPDRLDSFNNININYDNYLNPTSYGDISLSYTRGRILSSHCDSTETNSQVITEFTYDKDLNRIHKAQRSVLGSDFDQLHLDLRICDYLYDEGRLIVEKRYEALFDETHYLRFIYGIDGITGFLYDQTQYVYLKDALGNIVAILDSTLNIVAKYTYDAFGNHTVCNPNGTQNLNSAFIGNINPIRYKGYYYDTETGYYYCKTRYYNPVWRRWLNADDLSYLDAKTIGGLNLYCYCLDNPIMYKDENGNSVLVALLIGALVGAAVGVVGQLTADLIHSAIIQEWEFSSWEQYLGAGIGGALGGALFAAGYVGFIPGFISSATSTFVGNGLEVLNGKQTTTLEVFVAEVVGSGLAGGLINEFSGKLIEFNKLSMFIDCYKAGLEAVAANNAAIPLSVLAKGTLASYVESYGDVAFQIIYKLLNG